MMLLDFIKLCFTNTREVVKSLYNFTLETTLKNHVIKKYKLDKGLPVIEYHDLVGEDEYNIDNYTFLVGAAQPTDIALLKHLSGRFNKCRFIEFGTLRGESLFNVAQIAEECVSISFSEQEMRKFGVDEYSISVTRMFSRGLSNVVHIEHNTQTYDFSALEGKFDLVFVDADHKYEGVKIDTRIAFKLLKNDQSIIVWHDYGRTYEGINWQVFAGILDGCPDDEHRAHLYRVSNSICAIYMKNAPHSGYPKPRIPTKTFALSLKAQKL